MTMICKPFRTFVRGSKLGLATRATLSLERCGKARLEVEMLIPSSGHDESTLSCLRSIELVRAAFDSGQTLPVACFPIGNELLRVDEATVVEFSFKEQPLATIEPTAVDQGLLSIGEADVSAVNYATDHKTGITKLKVAFSGPATWTKA